jgi:hypothetical protein
VDRVEAAGAAASIDDARIIVAGGRGVGGPDGFGLVGDLAEALGGAVGATRAAVDSGWIPYSQQIGQTGKIVKPRLYLALGISGAIQHKVGMQTAGTIVAVNRDPDAPIADFADMLVVDDLVEELERAERALAMVEHGAAILAQVRRRGRELEAQTAIKRGYLNLLHAREAIARQAQLAQELEPGPDEIPPNQAITVRDPRS